MQFLMIFYASLQNMSNQYRNNMCLIFLPQFDVISVNVDLQMCKQMKYLKKLIVCYFNIFLVVSV